jgi:DNA-binding response OmpR family regulator
MSLRTSFGRRLVWPSLLSSAWVAVIQFSGAAPRSRRAGKAQRAAAPTSQPATSRRRILVVDDEPAIRMVCRVNLAASGMDVLEAGDGSGAVELAKKELPDLVLLDVFLPGLDGWEVAEALRSDASTEHIPVVFLTAQTELTDQLHAHELGGVGYIVKPFDPLDLAPHVEEVLARIERGDRDGLRRERLAQLRHGLGT